MSLIFLFCGLTHNHLGAYPPSHGGISTVCKLTRNVSVYGDASYLSGVSGESLIALKGNVGLRVTW
jgi:hypothetical protein